jgi:signal transduction histidine kinase
LKKNADTHLMTRYQRLIEISRDIASTLELDLLLNRITQAAAELTHSQAASILLYDSSHEMLFFQAANNMDRPLMRGLSVPVENSIAGWIVQQGEPVIVHDPKSDPRFFSGVQEESNTVTHSLMGVPLIVKEQVIGALETINKIDGDFTLEDQDVLMTLGSQAAVAIENARLFAQSDLIAEMVHELRTPLASLKAATHLLLKPGISEDQTVEIIEAIQRETDRLSDMTADFLDLARLESGRQRFDLDKVDLDVLIGEVLEITENEIEEAGLTLAVQIDPDLPQIMADPDKIKQVLLNLVSNAIKYNCPAGRITIGARQQDGGAALFVSDTGAGIPEDAQDRLFEKFYRVPGTEALASGIGLGLAIVYRIVQAHAGQIRIESTIGEGTTFIVQLPLDPE